MNEVDYWRKRAIDNGISYQTYWNRVNNLMWPPKRAATQNKEYKPSKHRKWIDIAKENGISEATYRHRVHSLKWSKPKAATTPIQKRDDRHWQEIAKQNGISRDTYIQRVYNYFWSEEEAATTPVLTKEEISKIGHETQSEIREIIYERAFNDPDNLFKLTPQHIEIAKKNGISEMRARKRVSDGWTVQDAISIPLQLPLSETVKDYEKYQEVAKKNGINYHTFYQRYKRGMSLQDAATVPVGSINPKKRADNDWIIKAEAKGIKKSTYITRVDELGWTPEEAATTMPLKRGHFLNEETKNKSRKAFKEFLQRKYKRK